MSLRKSGRRKSCRGGPRVLPRLETYCDMFQWDVSGNVGGVQVMILSFGSWVGVDATVRESCSRNSLRGRRFFGIMVP